MHARGDPKHAKQTCYLRDREHPGRVLLPKLISEDQALQNGGHPCAQRPAKSRRLDGQDRPAGCILHGPHGRGGQKLPPLPVEGKGISVQLPTLQSVIRPLGFYQNHMAGGSSTKGAWAPHDHLHRRYPHSGRDRVFAEGPHHGSGIPAGKPGVCHQPPQITINPHPRDRIPGICGELQLHGEKKKIKSETAKALRSQTVTALMLSRLIGKMNAAFCLCL